MTEQKQDAAALDRLLAPVLAMRASEPNAAMARTVGEGLSLPAGAAIIQRALPKSSVGRLLQQTVDWIAEVIRPEWQLPDPADRLFAVRSTIEGQDAFIGAWTREGRIFQVIVTAQRLHLLTRLANPNPAGSDSQKAEAALSQAFELLRLPEKPATAGWTIRPFGGLTLGSRQATFTRNWPETLLFLTDGSGVKYSVMKYKDRSSPSKGRPGTDAPPRAWFPPP